MTVKPKIIMVGGPTAVGKTALAIELAQKFNGIIVNADAFQVYQGMDIGTAKPTAAEQRAAEHRLIDILPPTESFSVAQFMARAETEITAIRADGKLPILVGGTGFYLNALRLGLPLGQDGASPLRQKWQEFAAQSGQDALWDLLRQRDPDAAAKIPAANVRRVVRALEVIEQTGALFSKQKAPEPKYDALVIGLTTDRELLYERINARVDAMIDAGLVDEVRRVVQVAGSDAQALAAIGYKELLPYLQGAVALDEAVALIKRNSRRYAKRQLTYFKNQMHPHWFDLVTGRDNFADVTELVYTWLEP
ncbi:tRNA (adenosine(37)-N6)-dimethylallyltransferase MiaA [Lacticaseibacillus hulanensis]|uniref:tRNA (adenosine(37)-N6)-dimethylallyltransferase MiaA n=1 Tax=Lacticaseibacillus hulanensis TaxID=2493111 RepID=UPI000FD98385|nr:tRNA (adenosine(37)-N6)-dimethylallyltransferase MiaA [Lacticaseibacillus hulanensis]